jgi:TRAP-type C4-dicarboxylate transport system permease small subunit
MEESAQAALRWAAAVLLLALLVCVFLGVVSRQLNAPLAWTDELAQYLLVWTGFAGWLLASRNRSHIRITVVGDKLPARARIKLEIAIQAAVAAFGAGIVYFSFALIKRNLDVESISLPIPHATVYLPLPLLGLALILQAARELRASVRGWRG